MIQYIAGNVAMGCTPFRPRLIEKKMGWLQKTIFLINKEVNTHCYRKKKKVMQCEKGAYAYTGIAAEVIAVPSIDTIPCRGVIYLLIR